MDINGNYVLEEELETIERILRNDKFHPTMIIVILENLEIIHTRAEDLANKIKELGKDCLYMPDFDEVVSYIKEHAKDDDIIITLGAGTVTKIGPMILA